MSYSFLNPTVEQIDGRSSVSEVIHSDLFCWVIVGSCFRVFFFLYVQFQFGWVFSNRLYRPWMAWVLGWLPALGVSCLPSYISFCPLCSLYSRGPGLLGEDEAVLADVAFISTHRGPPEQIAQTLSPVTCQYWQDPTVWIPRKNVIRNYLNSRKEWWSWKCYVAGRRSLKSLENVSS